MGLALPNLKLGPPSVRHACRRDLASVSSVRITASRFLRYVQAGTADRRMFSAPRSPAPRLNRTTARPSQPILGRIFDHHSDFRPGCRPSCPCSDRSPSPPRQGLSPKALPSPPVLLCPFRIRGDWEESRDAGMSSKCRVVSRPSCLQFWKGALHLRPV